MLRLFSQDVDSHRILWLTNTLFYVYTRCNDISEAIKTIESNKKTQAAVLKSANPAVLTGGLDLNELYNPDEERLRQFWHSYQQVFIDLYGSRLAFVSAIEGHAPGAGCMLAMACDHRVMAASEGKRFGTIGLNEAQFGLVAPPWMGQLLLRTVGFRAGEEALSMGTLFSPEEALEVGLVDKVVRRDVVLDTSYEVAGKFAKIPSQARYASKMLARKEYVDHLLDNREWDVNHFCNVVLDENVQKGLGAYLAKLRSSTPSSKETNAAA